MARLSQNQQRLSRALGQARLAIIDQLEQKPSRHPILFDGKKRTIGEILQAVLDNDALGKKFVQQLSGLKTECPPPSQQNF